MNLSSPRADRPVLSMLLALIVVTLSIVWLASCGSQTPRKSVKAANEVIHDFDQRTERLCLGAQPVLSKSECQGRVQASMEAQRVVRASAQTVAACPVDAPCPSGDIASAAAQAALSALEGYVYRGAQ